MSTAATTKNSAEGTCELGARLRRAIEHLDRESARSSEHSMALVEARFRLAVLPETDLGEALELLRAAAVVDPLHPRYDFHLGRVLHRAGDPRAAVREYRHAIRLAPSSHRA